MVGDPGLGKSQMLRAVSQVAPRSVYVCANTTTATGLTVTAPSLTAAHACMSLRTALGARPPYSRTLRLPATHACIHPVASRS